MGEERKNEVQDPADQYRTDRRVETEPQPEPGTETKTVVEHKPTEESSTLEVRETVVKESAPSSDE